MGNVATSTGSASGAVVEISRTISDANYGMIGMANNLQQLATQLVFMKQEAGSTSKAIRNLKNAILSPTGVLIAISAFITILEAMSKRQREAEQTTKSLNEAIGQEVSSLEMLFGIAKNESLSKEARLESIKKINKEYPEYLSNVKLENINTEKTNELLEKQILLEIARAKVKSIADEIAKENIKLIDAESKSAIDSLNTTEKIIAGIAEKAGFSREEVTKRAIERGKKNTEKDIQESKDRIKLLTGELSEIIKDMPSAITAITGDDSDLSDKTRDKLLNLLKDYQDKVLELGAENEQQLLIIRRKAALKEAEELGAEKEDLLIIEKYYDKLSYDLFLENIEKRKKEREEESKKQIQDAKNLTQQLTLTISERFKEINQIVSSVASAFDSISKISQSYHDGEIQRLQRERDFVQNNNALSESEKKQSLERIRIEEEKAQVRKIKAERNFLIIQQTIALAETVMNAKKMIQEQAVLALKLSTMGTTALTEIEIESAKNLAVGKMSIGKFISQLGIGGGIAFAAAIGGIIASITTAKKNAKNQIAAVTGASSTSLSQGSAISAPDFNIVGASQQSQLAQTIAQSEQQPIQAYVVAEDITTAQQLDNNIIQGASLG